MEKGFTLIELIAVIILVALITLLTVPNLVETLRRAEEKNYQEFLKTVEIATEVYVEKNSDYLILNTPGDYVVVSLGNLIDDGLIDADTENPGTEKTINRDDTMTVTLEADFSKTFVFDSLD